jgi:hypothetical protein
VPRRSGIVNGLRDLKATEKEDCGAL